MSLLFLNSIESSPEIEMYGETIIDLTERLSNNRYKMSSKDIRKTYIVSDDVICKPAILAKFIYGREDFVDMMCHINGYSNPFSISSGDILIVPEEEAISKMFNLSDETFKNVALEQINKKTFNVDPRRNKNINRLPTNINISGKRHSENGNMLILGGGLDENIKFDINKKKQQLNNDIYDTIIDLSGDVEFM